MPKIFITGDESRDRVMSGIAKVAAAMHVSIGPSGGNAIIARPYQTPLITNDGKDICDSIELDDETEQLGKEIVADALDKAEAELGNGRKTTTVLLNAICEAIIGKTRSKGSLVSSTADIPSVCAEIMRDAEKAIGLIKKQSKKTDKQKDIEKVAAIATRDEEIGKSIASMLIDLGPESHIVTETSVADGISFEAIKGFNLGVGLTSHLFRNEKASFDSVRPLIAVTNDNIVHESQLVAMVEHVIAAGKPAILMADGFSKEMLSILAQNHADGAITIVPIKPPVFANMDLYKDYATALGARFIDKDAGGIASIKAEDFGTCAKATIDNDACVFIGIEGDTKERIADMREALMRTASAFERKVLNDRIGKISGGVGFIRVGGYSEKEKEYLTRKIKDGVRTAKLAMQFGVSKGAGLAYVDAADQMKGSIMEGPLRSPNRHISQNAGSAGISGDALDSSKVVTESLAIASRLACMVAMLRISIADKREPKKDISSEDEA
jgi:chaperonin GroEL